MSTRTIVQAEVGAGSARRAASRIWRFDRLILAVEALLHEREAQLREVGLASGKSAVAAFELKKMHLLLALLREVRQRAGGSLPSDPDGEDIQEP
jgi:hypothetical protein